MMSDTEYTNRLIEQMLSMTPEGRARRQLAARERQAHGNLGPEDSGLFLHLAGVGASVEFDESASKDLRQAEFLKDLSPVQDLQPYAQAFETPAGVILETKAWFPAEIQVEGRPVYASVLLRALPWKEDPTPRLYMMGCDAAFRALGHVYHWLTEGAEEDTTRLIVRGELILKGQLQYVWGQDSRARESVTDPVQFPEVECSPADLESALGRLNTRFNRYIQRPF